MQTDNNTRPTAVPVSNGVACLNGYGIRVTVERGHLTLSDGVGRQRRSSRFSRGRCPVRRLIIRGQTGAISLAAFEWCLELGIPIALVTADSRLMAYYGPPGAPDGPLKRAQALAAVTEEGVEIARSLLSRKLESQIEALETEFPRLGIPSTDDYKRRDAIGDIRSILGRVSQASELNEFLTLEGRAAQPYWALLAGFTLPWPDWTKERIPDHWQRISPREYGLRGGVGDARDPFNAILNYGFALLEIEVRLAAASQSLDPDLGILHVDKRRRESLIYDLMEPMRTKVTTLALQFCEGHGLRPHMFAESTNGVVRLSRDFAHDYAHWLMPQLARGAADVAGSFATAVRHITIPYRLIDERKATRKPSAIKGDGGKCGTCGKPLSKIGLKFCSRHCYLKYSVEVAQPVLKAHARLAELRSQGLRPGHGGEAAKKRGAAITESNKRRSLNLTDDERKARRAEQARIRRARVREQANHATA